MYRILLFVDQADSRARLEALLDEREEYEPIAVGPGETFSLDRAIDACVIDEPALARRRGTLEVATAVAEPVFLPILLLQSGDATIDSDSRDLVTGIVDTPLAIEEFRSRLESAIARREQSRELVGTRERLQKTLDAVNDAILVVDVDAEEIRDANPRASELLGYSREELLARSPAEDLHPTDDETAAFREFVESVAATGRGRIDGLYCSPKEGDPIVTDVSAARLDVAEEDGPLVVLSVRDVTDQKARQRELQRQRDEIDRLNRINRTVRETNRALVRADSRDEIEAQVCETLVESGQYLGVWIGRMGSSDADALDAYDPDAESRDAIDFETDSHDVIDFETDAPVAGSTTVVPSAWGGLEESLVESIAPPHDETEYPDSDPVKRALRSRSVAVSNDVSELPDGKRHAARRDVRSVVAVPITYQGRLYGLLVVYSADREAFDEVERAICADLGETIGHAIAAVKRSEEAQLFEEVVEQSGHAIYVTDPEGTIEYVNPVFERQTGYDKTEAVGRTPAMLNSGHHGEEFYADLWETILNGETWQSEVVNRRKNGQLYYVDQTIAPLTDETGEIHHFVAINNEITDRIVRQQQNQVLNRILRHNIRNQLNLIDGHAQLLRTTIEDGDRADNESRIEEHVETIRETVDDLVAVSEKSERSVSIARQPVPSTPQPICSVLERVVQSLRDRYPRATIALETPSGEAFVRARAERALEEVLENAVEHADRPEPTIETHVFYRNRDERRITVEVADDGPGIPPEERHVIEDGEETALYHGSGLGLWLVYWTVTLAGGDVTIEERSPRGTIVELTFPVAPDDEHSDFERNDEFTPV